MKRRNSMRVFELSVVPLLLGTVILAGCFESPQEVAEPAGSDGNATTADADAPSLVEGAAVVTLIIDYGDGTQQHYTSIPWREEMTVQDTLDAARGHARPIDYKFSGNGETALLTEIDGLKNEGGAGNNWIYQVNGQLAEQGIGVHPVKSGDTILWKFSKYR